MFRAAATGPFDEVVAKATDENLTSEDWGAIMEVCDKVSGDQNGPKEAVQSMMKRLAHRNANVQLYTLELAHALCQNCGLPIHREISSRAFTDSLLRLANDRNTHGQVKAKILEKMKDWSDMFGNDSELGVMYDAYHRLKQSNPTLQAPSAPQKQGLTESDRQKEEDELQMALRLSLQDEERKKAAPAAAAGAVSGSHAASAGQQHGSGATPSVPAGTTAATVSRVRALYDFVPSEAGELEFKKGDVIAVLESVYKDWWRGSLKGKTGIFPLNYVEKLTDPTPEELQREAQMEAEVFAEIKNVEKLLTLLSTSNTAPREEDNDEISKLYHQTLAIRPKLIKLIEKYSQKKDDFTQLNEKFIKARRDYEALLESSMSQPLQHKYHQYAMRPGPPGQAYPPGAGEYGAHDTAKYYASGPHGDQQQAPSSAPFYVAGTEVPSQASHQPAYPPREPSPRHAKQQQQQHAPSSPQTYALYSQAAPSSQPRPTSTYGAQELATSAYDSPVVPHNASFASQQQQQQPQQQQQQQQGSSSGAYGQQQVHYQGYNPPDHAPPPVSDGQPPGEQRYKPYVPPSGGPSAPNPSDYYR
ncbi:hypothetical protein CDD80_2201 [Ophiocordyceps camponoti-rufipedis]|uniref:Class E vacuolar protein-sorting machinery protein HSE1 n=1 Tax=Ophiocordyceps camponoti-rufipedis TaxID=2004952 RepID=A0A2C5YC49_9HYPO|nr:hypothetical protein CDD80_2201 [Ophiocordyceps camponoti-rufipedis]